MITLKLTHAEAAALSAACLYSDGKKRHPELQKARIKLREALNGKPVKPEDYGKRYVALEC